MTKVFDEYAYYYDLLYKDKNYVGEVAYITNLLKAYGKDSKRILELGCGTGKHAALLASNGYYVYGIDKSKAMLEIARNRVSANTSEYESDSNIHFNQADITCFDLHEKFDAVISLFHVMSYQTTEAGISQVLMNVARHLKKDGIFIFDTWYGPAVLWQKPEVRVRRLGDEKVLVTRIAEPILKDNDNICEVHYDIFVKNKASGRICVIQEVHVMRYWFLPEVRRLAESCGFELLDCFEFMTGKKLGRDTWGSRFVLRIRVCRSCLVFSIKGRRI